MSAAGAVTWRNVPDHWLIVMAFAERHQATRRNVNRVALLAAPAVLKSPGWRRATAVLLLGLLVGGWGTVGLRLYFLPPVAGYSSSVFALQAVVCGLNATVLGFLAWWLWRGAHWAALGASALLLANALMILQPEMADLERVVLTLTLLCGAVITSLLARPEAMKLL